ncbi:hypothetical protein [Frankia sp. AgB32]|nr:hypothetical protein [Frankia sp. AgB32]
MRDRQPVRDFGPMSGNLHRSAGGFTSSVVAGVVQEFDSPAVRAG